MTKIYVLKEAEAQEARVAATPDTIKRYKKLGLICLVEAGAGKKAGFLDQDYKDAGAKISKEPDADLKAADIILCVSRPAKTKLNAIKKDAVIIGALNPYDDVEDLQRIKSRAFSMEKLPRITRAQSMDILSSQANLAGYKAVLEAANHLPKAFPMLMTAAGTIAPAKVFVMGVGVAGLQAIATAKRLGAVVSATDVRPAVKDQVRSLGANFVAVENDEFKAAETAGGYAKEMSKSYQKLQQKLVKETIAKQDIVVTTALIPGKKAPILIDAEMVKSMKAGSVIVDLATARGGNCALSEKDKVIEKQGIKIVGYSNFSSMLAQDASSLYARNLYNLIAAFTKDGNVEFDLEDELIKAINIAKKTDPEASPKKTTTKKKAA